MSALSAKPNDIGLLGTTDKNKQWQRELLMERLRSHSSQHKTFQELSKSMRMSMLEKRYALDAVEKSNLQKCLDSMQHCIKVTTRQGLVERLESLSRQLGLKFVEDNSGLFISSDMFFLEIILDANGTLSDVKVHHECKIEQQSCSELVTCLMNGDFADFTIQLEGLSSIYQLNAEPKIKSKAFVALQAMETDLHNIFMSQNFHKDTQQLLYESIVGVVQKRRGGHPMKITYFVSPYELLSFDTKSIQQLTIDLLSTKNIGMSITLNLEASSSNKLQILPTITFNKDSQGVNSLPIYSPMTATNSTLLPATFVLRLNKPLPISDVLMQSIATITDIPIDTISPSTGNTGTSSIMDLIVQNASEGLIENSSKGLFVSLPDQNHCYFFSKNKLMKGSIISSVPFTEPSHVPKIVTILRQQALFYTLLSSCVRTQGKMGDMENTTMIEVNAISLKQISVGLEHPYEESMVTIEFDLNDVCNIICRIFSLTTNYDSIAEKLSQIVQKCLSIPITIRSLLKCWEQDKINSFHRGIENGNFNLPLGPNDPGGRNSEYRDINKKNERNSNGGFSNGARQFFHSSSVMMGAGTDTFSDTNVNMFDNTQDNPMMMNQFGIKTNHESPSITTGKNFNDPTISSSSSSSTVSSSSSIAGGGSGAGGSVGGIIGKDSTVGEDFYKNPKSNKLDILSQNSSETSDSNSLGATTSIVQQQISQSSSSSDLGVATMNFQQNQFHNVDNVNHNDNSNSINNFDLNLSKTADTHEKAIHSNDWQNKSNFNEKIQNVSITPVTTTGSSSSTSAGIELNTVLSGMGLERRPGIEIIPITAATTQSLPTSITITPINSIPSSKSEKQKSSSSKRYNDDGTKSKSDKKRKRKKDDTGSASMGPPEKILSKDHTSRSISVSIKTSEGSGGIIRKFSTSSQKIGSPLTSSSSSTNTNSNIRPSPKSSPSHNSPKHALLGSPKTSHHYGTASPKHGGSSSGKPSMSTLKSATTSSPKSSEKSSSKSISSSFRDRDRDKDKDRERSSKNSSTTGNISPKIKSSTIKLKQIDLSAAFLSSSEQSAYDEISNTSTSTTELNDVNKSPTSFFNSQQQQNKVRKSSLSAIVDKLKLAQNTNDFDNLLKSNDSDDSRSSNNLSKTVNNSTFKNSSANSNTVSSGGCMLNSEYMIKPSLDGMKITINKTRTKELPSSGLNKSSSVPSSSSSSVGNGSKFFSSIGSGSPKRHTGLKPGVSSGPASRKNQISHISSKSLSGPLNVTSSLQGKATFQKSNSSGNLSTSSSSSSSSTSSITKNSFANKHFNSTSFTSDMFKKDKLNQKLNKFNNNSDNKLLNPASSSRGDPTDVMKILRFASPNNSSIEGFMKTLNTKFQIPKLSARNHSNATTSTSNTISDVTKKDLNRFNNSLPTASVAPLTTPATSTLSTSISSSLMQTPLTTFMPTTTCNTNDESTTGGNLLMGTTQSTSSSSSLNDILSKDLSMKYPFSIGKIPLMDSSTTQNSNTKINNTPLSSKFSNYFTSNQQQQQQKTNQKSLNSEIMLNKDLVLKNNLGSAITSTSSIQLQNNAIISSAPSSTMTPSNVIGNNMLNNINNVISISNNMSPAYRPSPAPSPNILNDEIKTTSMPTTIKRPSSVSDIDFNTIKQDNKILLDQQRSTMTEVSSTAIPMSSVTKKISNILSVPLTMQSSTITNNTTTTVSGSIPHPLPLLPPPTSLPPTSLSIQPQSHLASSTMISSAPHKLNFSSAPSVSLHIVKSPVSSPLMVLPSPHSNSPCITDDELMDEALVGIGSK